jgi:hypothetical protein
MYVNTRWELPEGLHRVDVQGDEAHRAGAVAVVESGRSVDVPIALIPVGCVEVALAVAPLQQCDREPGLAPIPSPFRRQLVDCDVD